MTDEARDLADEAAEAIRSLNHLTLGGTGLEDPGDLYSVVANLASMAGRLPQLLTQLGQWLEHEHTAGRVGHDSGGDVDATVADVQDKLRAAYLAAEHLRVGLGQAHNDLAHLKAT